MKYRVKISELASEQIDEAYTWLAEQTINADAWHEGLLKTIASLENFPLRCPRVPEKEDPTHNARQHLYGVKKHTYRIIFDVKEDVVNVLQVLHGARERWR